ncbi:MAG: hypothetical protein OXH75_15655 [Acidobacteria bacterium]|nr:hypothetical protein [Acidobacteriota bacterium]
MSVQRVRELAGDDGPRQQWTDDEVQGALDANSANAYLAAAELRDRLQARAGENFGTAWDAYSKRLREEGTVKATGSRGITFLGGD